MSSSKSVIGLAVRALALLVVVGLGLGPEVVMRRLDEALTASWKALSDRDTSRALDEIAMQLDHERQNVKRIVDLRDGLGTRLLALEAMRELVAARLGGGSPTYEAEPQHELARLDDAIVLLSSVIARAGRLLDRARSDLGEREVELITLQAEADARRMGRTLSRFVVDPSL